MNRLRMRWLIGALALLLSALPGPAPALSTPQDGAPAMGNARMVQGTVTAATPNRITLKTQGGDVYAVTVSPNTQVRRGRDQMKLADLHVGDGVGAMGELDPNTKTIHALFLTVVTAEDLQRARDALGKTFIAGTVLAMQNLKLTIKRSDGVEQVIQVDEDTSFRRGGRNMQQMANTLSGGAAAGQRSDTSGSSQPEGESITLADIKVGSTVAGPGALKNGVFVPTELGVRDPQARRQRRSQDEQGSPAPATPPFRSPDR